MFNLILVRCHLLCVYWAKFVRRVLFFFLRLIAEFYTTHCMSCIQLRAAVSKTTKSPLQLCSGHSLAMCCAVWFAAPHSRDADGDSPICFMLDLNRPQSVLLLFRRTSECRDRSCPMGLLDRVWTNSLNRQHMMSHFVLKLRA